MSVSNLVVIFGSGPVGLFTAKELIKKGKRVRLVNRSGKLSADQKAAIGLTAAEADNLELRACLLDDPSAVIETSRGTEAIVHAANPPNYLTWERDLPVWQKHIVAAALQHKVPLGVTENLYSYAADIMPMTETSREAPRTKKGKLRLRMHEMLLGAEKEQGLDWVSVRASDFYGPGATMQSYFGDRFMDPLYTGKTPALIGRTDRLHSYCFVGDFGFALATVLLDSEARKRVWFAPHIAPKTGAEMAEHFFAFYAARHGGNRPNKVGAVPSGLIRLVGIFNPFLRELGEMLFEFDEVFTVDSSNFEKTFNVTPTPIEEGVRKTFEWQESRSRKS